MWCWLQAFTVFSILLQYIQDRGASVRWCTMCVCVIDGCGCYGIELSRLHMLHVLTLSRRHPSLVLAHCQQHTHTHTHTNTNSDRNSHISHTHTHTHTHTTAPVIYGEGWAHVQMSRDWIKVGEERKERREMERDRQEIVRKMLGGGKEQGDGVFIKDACFMALIHPSIHPSILFFPRTTSDRGKHWGWRERCLHVWEMHCNLF